MPPPPHLIALRYRSKGAVPPSQRIASVSKQEPSDGSPAREVSQGDIPEDLSSEGISRFVVERGSERSEVSTLSAVRDVLGRANEDELVEVAAWLDAVLRGHSPDELAKLGTQLQVDDPSIFGTGPMDPDDELGSLTR
jgi:hypothetical protein